MGAKVAVRLDVGGDTYVGTNLARGLPGIPGTISFFTEHAEGEAFLQALDSTTSFEGDPATLYLSKAEDVEPVVCSWCQRAISTVAGRLGLSDLTVLTPDGFWGSWDPVSGWYIPK
jgi:hypothetical protein